MAGPARRPFGRELNYRRTNGTEQPFIRLPAVAFAIPLRAAQFVRPFFPAAAAAAAAAEYIDTYHIIRMSITCCEASV
jgi:hypothetical protein